MRKILIFLLAFGSGFALLWMLRTPEVDGGNGGQEVEQPITNPGVLTPVSSGDQTGAISIALSGRIEDTKFFDKEVDGEQRRQYVFVAEDSRPLGRDVYELTNLRFEFYDFETGDLFAEAESTSTEMRFETDGKGNLVLGEEINLTNVELTMHRGMPVVPITVRVPLLTAVPETNRFRSSDLVQVEAQGVEAEGTGLDVDMQASSLRLVRDGRIELDLERGGKVVLEAIGVGPIDFLRFGTDDAPQVEIRARENARLTLEGAAPGVEEPKVADPIVAVGREIVIRAASLGAPEARRFRASDAFVTGGTTIEGQNSVFRSRRADVAFDDIGQLEEVVLVGEPTGRVELARFLDVQQNPELFATFADISGQGPLRIRLTGGTGLNLDGPGEVVIPERDLRLTANDRIVGFVTPERSGARAGEIQATGDVRVVYQGRTLESETIALQYASPGPGEEAVDLDTEGPTVLTGRDAAGRDTKIVADGGGKFRSRAGRISAPLVRGVRVEVVGDGGYVASADEVRDLDLEARTFVAEGNVVYEAGDVRGTGDRAVSKGPDELELFGRRELPARFQLWKSARRTSEESVSEAPGEPGEGRVQQGDAEALKMVLARGRVVAQDEVACSFALADERYRLTCEELELDYAPEADRGRRPFEVRARRACRVELVSRSGVATLGSRELDVKGTFLEGEAAELVGGSLGRTELVARGEVEIDYGGPAGLRGTADVFVVDERGKGRLSMTGEGGRVYAIGVLPTLGLPYELTAKSIEFDRERVEAHGSNIDLIEPDGGEAAQGDGGSGSQDVPPETTGTGTAGSGGDAAPSTTPLLAGQAVVRNVKADNIVSDKSSILLDGHAHIDGVSEEGEPWSIDAGAIQVLGRFDPDKGSKFSIDDVDLLEARGGFVARLGERMQASGRKLAARPGRVRIEGGPARFEVSGMAWESDWIELDPDNLLVGTGRGVLRPVSEDQDWELTYESMQPFDDVDATLLVLRNPLFTSAAGRRELRAAWALFWLDKGDWSRSTGELIGGETKREDLRFDKPVDSAPPGSEAGGEQQMQEYASLLNEIYIEGNIEFLEEGRRIASAQAFYLNRLDGHGWMQDANMLMELERSGKAETVRVKANWMRVTAELEGEVADPTDRIQALRADQAVITSCTFEEPHYVIETGDLRIRRNEKSAIGFDFSARKNKARFASGLVIPLPPLNFGTDDEGNPTIGGFEIGNSARFGSVVSATANLPLPDWSRKLISSPLDLTDEDVTGGTRTSLGFLSSRGVLFGIGQQIRASDRMWLDVFYDAVPDSGKDIGLVRSKEDSGTSYRDWIHGRGRLLLKKGEWVDLAFTKQRDAGFQSEFFEREFIFYEEQDNYLHWRKADNNWYFDASVAARLEDFRDYVEELPAGGAYLSPTPVTTVAGKPMLYTSSTRAGYYGRKIGTDPKSPFSPVFAVPDLDGDGQPDDFDVLRFDTTHSVELPVEVGFAGLKATPYVTGRATVWDEGLEGESAPARFGGFAGLQLATTAYRTFGNGSIHQISPILGVRAEIATAESGDTPVQIDQTESSIKGNFVDLGFRTLWWKPKPSAGGRDPSLDLEVRATHGSNTEVGDGWLPIKVLGSLLTYAGDIPVGLTHDGRYDVDDDAGTIYSFSGLGFEPRDDLGVEFGYSQGKESAGTTLFRAASIGARYRANAKWEFGARHSISLLDEGGLFTSFLVRRIGHDFVTEIEYEKRAGEGTYIGLGLQPRISWRRRPLGIVDNWLGSYR